VNATQPARVSTDAFVMKISPANAAVLALGPASVIFPYQLVGSPSSAESVFVSNAGSLSLTIRSITSTGDYAQTNTCPATLGPGKSCEIQVTFRPSRTGIRVGAITISNSTAASPHIVVLQGIGSIDPVLSFERSHLDFGRELVGTQTPPFQAGNMILNTGVTPLRTNLISIAGINPADFAIELNNCQESIAPGSYCSIFMSFKPTAAGVRSATAIIHDNAPGSPHAFPLTGTGVLRPEVSAEGVVDGATFMSAIVPGSIAAVFGNNLAVYPIAGSYATPSPISIDGVRVAWDATFAPLFYVSPGVIGFQVPWESYIGAYLRVELGLGPQYGRVTRVAGGNTVYVRLADYAPRIFTMNSQNTAQGAIVIASTGEFAAPTGAVLGGISRPAHAGEFIVIYCTGLGAVTNQPRTGDPAFANPPSLTTTTPTVSIGGVPAPATDGFFSGLTPGSVGLYQINVQIPSGVPAGNAVPVVVTIGGASSNVVSIAVE
jgi:uncharacterized protein (TIGR03437 family)